MKLRIVGYIKDDNGEIYSEDRKVRYRILIGDEFIEYKNSEEGKKKQFYEMEDDGEIKFFDTTIELQKKFLSEDNHSKYLKRCKAESGVQEVSYNTTVVLENETVVEMVESLEDDTDTADEAINNCDVKRLRRALKQLKEDEYELVFCLYLAPKRMSLKKYAELKKVPRRTMRDRKKKIFEKIKNLL